MKSKIWLSPPHMGGMERKYVNEAFETNWIAPLGPNVDNFEHDISNYCKVKYTLALSSGTAAIHLALLVLGIESGDEVIAPTFTFSATINPILYQGAVPIFIDSEIATWNMNPDLLEFAIRDRIAKGVKPKAIIVVHLYGMPADMKRICHIAKKYDIPIIEDAAEALGSRYNGETLGSFGRLSILSFNGNKIITTSGGGALISNDGELIGKARYLATQARDNTPHYQHRSIGYNYRLSNILAGLGRGQMKVINSRVEKRREINHFYKKKLNGIDGMRFLEEPNELFFSNHWLTTILLDQNITGFSVEQLRIVLEQENIESRPLWKPMHLQPVFQEFPKYIDGTSENLFNQGLCLPSGSSLSQSDQNRVISVILGTVLGTEDI